MENKLKIFLKSHYPVKFEGNWKVATFTGLFIAFFLFFFQPFGLSLLKIQNKEIILLGYGLVTFVVLFINTVILPQLLKSIFTEYNWTYGKHLLLFLWIFFTIGIGNFIYSGIVFDFSLNNLSYFAVFEGLTVGVGIIPVFFIILYNHNVFLKTTLKDAKQLTENLPVADNLEPLEKPVIITFSSYNGKNTVQIEENDVLFIESEGNYCNIYHLQGNTVKKTVLRTTMKKIEDLIPENTSLFKSHRAFIINLKQIHSIKGNSQGYRIIFNKISKEASVSRQYIKEFKKLLKNYKGL